MKKKVYVNGVFFSFKYKTGMFNFALKILNSIANRSLNEIDLYIIVPDNSLSLELIDKRIKIIKLHYSYDEEKRFSLYKWNYWYIFKFLIKQKDYVLLNFHTDTNIFLLNRTYHFIMDDIFITYYKSKSLNFRTFLYFNFGKKIATLSKTVQIDLEKRYHKIRNDIDVVYCSNSFEKNIITKNEPFNDYTIFILSVSNNVPHKNFKILKSLSLLDEFKYKIKIIGHKVNNDVKDNTKLEYLGYLSEEELVSYYKNAFCFVFPSFIEGFGIPPLDAQMFGIPIVISDIPVHREVYGDSALYFNPNSVQDLATKIKILKDDFEFRSQLIKKGNENVKKYNWDHSADIIIQSILIM